MNPDGSEQRIYAQGLHNAVGLKWVGKFLFATNQGADHLGKSKPDEAFYALKRDADYGWPSCYSSNGKILQILSLNAYQAVKMCHHLMLISRHIRLL